MRKAFTLIELLVVIAIIAILAAILFPVFAQAKEAAKKAQDLSNAKQYGVAEQMYLNDADDMNVPAFTVIAGGVCLPTKSTECGYRSMWQFIVYPYLKSTDLFTAPGESKKNSPVPDAFHISYGYNYGYLSTLCVRDDTLLAAYTGCPAKNPDNPSASQWFQGRSASSVVKPANTVMFSSSGGKDMAPSGAAATILGSLVNPPDAWPATLYFYGPAEVGWGLNCKTYYSKASLGGSGATGKWGDTDGFAARHNDQANVVFCDSHAKSLKVGAAAAGTNYNPKVSCTKTVVTEYANYIWDPRYDSGPGKY